MLALAVVSSLAMAGDKVSETAKADFAAYCASCHGVDGMGNGPLADTLKVKPTDLTVISKKNDGIFLTRCCARRSRAGSWAWRARTVRGKCLSGVRSSARSPNHPPGGSGGDYSGSFAQCVNLAARARVMNIADYIESIQK